MDKCLPFGAACSCFLFEMFSTFLHWLVITHTCKPNLDHYLDDYMSNGPPSDDSALVTIQTFHQVADQLALPISTEKYVPPTTQIVFLGLGINSSSRQIFVPEANISKAKSVINRLLAQEFVSLRLLQSLLGLLNYLCRAILPGRPFLNNGFEMVSQCGPGNRIQVSVAFKEDMRVWLSFIPEHVLQKSTCPLCYHKPLR